MAETIQAKDCKCCVCGKPAVAFWPACDLDIPSHPYCRKCLAEALNLAILSIMRISRRLPDEDVRFIADKERLLEDISKVITKSLTGE